MSAEGDRLARFSAALLRHTKGQWGGQPLVFEPWQREDFGELLRRVDGRRVYRQGLYGISRKNSKSTSCSALCGYGLIVEGLEEPGCEVYAAAASKEQARIVFSDTKKMLQSSPVADYLRFYRDAVEVPDTGAIFRVLAADALKLHGLNPHLVIGDELHAWRDPELWYALATAGGARRDPLIVGITTAGWDLNSLCYELYVRGKEGAEPDFFFKWYEASEPDDPATWKEANPASWITQEWLERESKRLPRSVFNRLHLNVWTKAETMWLPPGTTAGMASDLEIPAGEGVYVGMDLGWKNDHTALVTALPGSPIVTRADIFATYTDLSKARPPAHHIFEEDRQSHRAVLERVLAINARNPIIELVYDPAGAVLMIEELEQHGIPCVEVPQTNARMAQATELLYGLITTGEVVHDGDPHFNSHLEAAVAKSTQDGERLWKTRDRQPMDAAIALALAVSRAHQGAGRPLFRFLDEVMPINENA